MKKRPPILNGVEPNKEYDLDNELDLRTLGLNTRISTKIADKYVHYKNCKHAVIEFKSSTLRKAVDQIQATVEQLVALGKNVDFPIIVAKRLSRWEKRIFKRGKDHILYNPETNKPYIIRTGSKSMPVLLFYSSEIDKMYYSLDRYFGGEN